MNNEYFNNIHLTKYSSHCKYFNKIIFIKSLFQNIINSLLMTDSDRKQLIYNTTYA